MAETKLSSGQTVSWENVPHPSIYTNIMQFGLTPFDISFTFGEIGEASADHVQAIPRAKIILSPEQAANLIRLLDAALKAYTHRNGQLRDGGSLNLDEVNRQLRALAEQTE